MVPSLVNVVQFEPDRAVPQARECDPPVRVVLRHAEDRLEARPSRRHRHLRAPELLPGGVGLHGVDGEPDGLARLGAEPQGVRRVGPEAQGRLQTIFFLTVGLVEAMFFINLAFMALFVFVLG